VVSIPASYLEHSSFQFIIHSDPAVQCCIICAVKKVLVNKPRLTLSWQHSL